MKIILPTILRQLSKAIFNALSTILTKLSHYHNIHQYEGNKVYLKEDKEDNA